MRFRPTAPVAANDSVRSSVRALMIALAISLLLHALGVPVILRLLIDRERAALAGLGPWATTVKLPGRAWSVTGSDPQQLAQPAVPPAPEVLPARDSVRQDRSEEQKPPPKLRPGSETGDEQVRVAWISWDEYQKLIAPRGSTEQPAVQMAQEPVERAAPSIGEPGFQPSREAVFRTEDNRASSGMDRSLEQPESPEPLVSQALPGPATETPVSEKGPDALLAGPGREQEDGFVPVTETGPAKAQPGAEAVVDGERGTSGLELVWAPVQERGQVAVASGGVGSSPSVGQSDADWRGQRPSAAGSDRASAQPGSSADVPASQVPAAATGPVASAHQTSPPQMFGATGAEATGRPTSAPRADKESPPVSLTSHPLDVKLQPGAVLVGRGVEIKTVVPRLSTVARYMIPRNPQARIVFNRHGEVISVTLLKSTGYEAWDAPVLASLYRWRAAGQLLQEHEGPFEMVVNLIFVEGQD